MNFNTNRKDGVPARFPSDFLWHLRVEEQFASDEQIHGVLSRAIGK